MILEDSLQATLDGVDALVVCTCCELFKETVSPGFFSSMRTPLIIDPTRFLYTTLEHDKTIGYVAIGLSV